jgi:hypothetical protein
MSTEGYNAMGSILSSGIIDGIGRNVGQSCQSGLGPTHGVSRRSFMAPKEARFAPSFGRSVVCCVFLEAVSAERISKEIAQHLGAADGAGSAAFSGGIESEDGGIACNIAPHPLLGAVIRTKWRDTRAAANRLGFTVGTMQTYLWMGTGPTYRKIGRRVVYSAVDLDSWVAKHQRTEGRVINIQLVV